MESSKQTPELKQLNPIVGKWITSGEILATSSSPAVSMKGTDSYEWVCGGKFLLHRVYVLMGDEQVEVIEIIGYSASDRNYPMRSFDNHGNFTTMKLTADDKGILKITGEGMRSTLITLGDGNHMKAFWERSEDGVDWKPWMDMRFTKDI